MTLEVLGISLLIVCARVIDVSIGTLRIASLMRGFSSLAVLFGFFEALIWLLAVSKVTANLDQPIYIFAFAGGFALGNFVGLQLDSYLGLGSQVIRIFNPEGAPVATHLRDAGFSVTTFKGEGRDGPVDLLLMKCKRKKVPEVFAMLNEIAPKSFSIIDDVVDDARPRLRPRFGWPKFRAPYVSR